MDFVVNSNSIPIEKAIVLCKEHRKKHKNHLLSQCWVCQRYSKEDPVWMYFHIFIIPQKIVALNLLIDFSTN